MIAQNYLEVEKTKPKAADMRKAELVVNLVDQTIYTKDHLGEVVSVGGGGGGLIVQNQNTLEEDYALEVGFSGVVSGAFTVIDGVTLTIPDGSTLSCV